MTDSWMYSTYIAIFITHIDDAVVYVGRGTARQQQRYNH